jgi:RNA polymerase sigma factor (sigma-70 family)
MPPPAEGFVARHLVGPALRTQPDGRLVKLVRGGYETAFEEIVRRYGQPLRRYAAAIVGGSAEDVTQDAFSKALLALRRDGAEIELRPWLFRIVRNTALNDLRDRPPSADELAEALTGGGGNPAEEIERREELAELMRRLRALPEPQRAAIVMRELEGLGHEEIAAALGLSGGAARQAIYRARRALRDGFGMLLPAPLLKAMLSAGASAPAEVAAGAAGMGGAGVALKAATATVLVVGAVGAGVAVDRGHPHRAPTGTSAARSNRSLSTRAFHDGPLVADDRRATTTSGEGADHEHRGSSPSDGATKEGSGSRDHGARHEGQNSGPSSSTGTGDRGGRDSGSGGDNGGGGEPSPGGGNGGTGGSSGPGGDSQSSGGESSPTSSGDDSSSSGDGSDSNSGPDSGGESTEQTSGTDDVRDPGSGDVFSVQETQP